VKHKLTQIARALALGAAVAAVAAPAFASAAVTQAAHNTVYYDATFQRVFGDPYPWQGTFQLQESSSGIINGYYRPYPDGNFIPVTGGRSGDSIWLTIGMNGRTQINGVLKDGKITGAAIDGRGVEYSFVATATASPE
jgi:hypothetical protein